MATTAEGVPARAHTIVISGETLQYQLFINNKAGFKIAIPLI